MEEILNIGIFESDDDDDIDELLVDHLLNDEATLGPRATLYGRFTLNNMLEEECCNLFRFRKADIVRLARALAIPERVTTIDRVTVFGKFKKRLKIKGTTYLKKCLALLWHF